MPLTVGNLLAGPLIALAVLGLFAVVLRRLLTSPDDLPLSDGVAHRSGCGFVPGLPLRDDYGLLVAAALTADPDVAAVIRNRLAGAGIRSTVATGQDGLVRVLVFEPELDHARRVVG